MAKIAPGRTLSTFTVEKDGKKKMITVPPFRLRGDRVMVYADEAESLSPGGIIIPDTAKEEPRVGTLIKVGPGEIDSDGINNCEDLSPGFKVWYGKYAGTEFEWKGNKFTIMRENDVLGIDD